MGDAQVPGGYFVGRPANFEDKPQDPAADAQTAETTPPESHEPPREVQAPATGGPKKTGFLGNLFSCFTGGRVAES